jgi:hypothetical protein
MEAYRNPHWRDLSQVHPSDPDIFAYDQNGVLLQKIHTIRDGECVRTRWEPIPTGDGVLYCQAASESFMQVLSQFNDDPREAFSNSGVRKQFGGHPDERRRY